MTDKPPTTAYRCAVIGNPIAHSRSPDIHAAFAQARGINLRYDRILAEAENFAAIVAQFFADGGRGLNITLPYKETAYRLCEQTSADARLAEAVNTLWQENGKLCGDNTDGRGLRHALEHEHAYPLAGKHILILGAGGAARGVIAPLCAARPASLHIANRTAAKAAAIIAAQQPHTTVPLTAGSLEDLSTAPAYDLIINATSAAFSQEPLSRLRERGRGEGISRSEITDNNKNMGNNVSFTLPDNIAHPQTRAYDMTYGRDTPFLDWARKRHLTAHDGSTMLQAQAWLSFQQWFPT